MQDQDHPIRQRYRVTEALLIQVLVSQLGSRYAVSSFGVTWNAPLYYAGLS